jgi:hypothetical protein
MEVMASDTSMSAVCDLEYIVLVDVYRGASIVSVIDVITGNT